MPLLKKVIDIGLDHEGNCEKYAICLFNTKAFKETKDFITSIHLKYSKNEQLVQFQPQSDYLKLIVYEDTSAIFLRNGIAFSAKWVWSLKKFIDKKFIRNFKKLSEMITRDIQNTANISKQMLCGGKSLGGKKTGKTNQP